MEGLLRRLRTFSVDGSGASPNFREDTPEIALKRQGIVRHLVKELQRGTPMCRKIQSEPQNALARFLFSGITLCGDARQDPLLPCVRFEDKSIMQEAEGAYTGEYATNLCHRLCDESLNGIHELEVLYKNTPNKSVTCEDANHFQNRLTYNETHVYVSKIHYARLERMYVKHCGDDADKKHFLRRLFCLLVRYETLGGPMYQCSCTAPAFQAMRAGFGVDYECFASPFNHNAERYWSAFPDTDCFFGSRGDFFTNVDVLQGSGGSFYANPPFVEEVMLLMKEKIEIMLGWAVPVTFLVVVPHWTDEPCHRWMMQQTQSGNARHQLLRAGHKYIEGSQQKNTRESPIEHTAHFVASLFLLQNELARKASTDADANFTRVCHEWCATGL